MTRATIRDLTLDGKRVLVRVDFNCPVKDGKVKDDNRIVAALPTLRYLLERNATLVLMSHLGRPKGTPDPKLSLAPVAERLSELLGQPVAMAPDCIGEKVEKMVAELGPGRVLLLENLRFHPGEKKNDPDFAKALAQFGEVYVNDAFGAAHRAHASTVGVTEFLPAVAGLLMASELEALGSLLTSPKRPFVAVLGGAKVSDKLGVLDCLIEKADTLLVGGGMAFSFLKAQGHDIGKSLCEADLDLPRRLLAKAKEHNTAFLLPVDVAVAPNLDAGQDRKEVGIEAIPADLMGLDIGSKTIETFREQCQAAGTIFWNGPMGVFEVPPFDQGTFEVARAVAGSGAVSCIGGGDSAAALRQMNLADQITHVSTGGGASLEFMEGKELPGVAALKSRQAIAN
ncbi:MAG: phosphoglycerate kinase, partial [Candidatus Eremiobacteraeota bacterium]|nr:phosphoglycerate kinase [Candidatus Eremiobacteraeota bacterium]